jgi:hypothetical protein
VVNIFLLIEFLDELVFGATEAAWPLVRSDLGLNYSQIGLAAEAFGLHIALWLLLLGPIAFLLGLPAPRPSHFNPHA